MSGPSLLEARQFEVWSRLETVTDPELDESLTALGFIEDVSILADDQVDIAFRLPTYWCSANFAFLMADDIRLAVEALPWVRAARPLLRDHMVADEVNDGVRRGATFGEVFSHFGATGTLKDLRETFRRKAFERRQEAVLLALRQRGHDAAALCAMTLADLDAADLDGSGAEQRPRYRALLLQKGLARQPGDPAFVSYGGRDIKPAEFAGYMQRLRGVRINMEFNSVLCRGLLEARYQSFDAEAGALAPRDAGCGCAAPCTRSAAVPVETHG